MMIRFVDITSAVLIIVCLAYKFKYRFIWLMYFVACISFTCLNYYKDLPGQGTMNLIAAGIAMWNFWTWKKNESA